MTEESKKIILELEKSLLRHDVRTSREKLGSLLANDFIEYGTSGRIYDKESTLKDLPSALQTDFLVTDFTVRELSPHVAIVNYKTEKSVEGQKIISLRTSIWKETKGQK